MNESDVGPKYVFSSMSNFGTKTVYVGPELNIKTTTWPAFVSYRLGDSNTRESR